MLYLPANLSRKNERSDHLTNAFEDAPAADRIIHTDRERGVHVIAENALSPETVQLLESTVWGQHGLIFRSLDMREMLGALTRPVFLRLVKDGETLAAAVRNRKALLMAGRQFDAVHLALFAVRPDCRRKGYGRILAKVSREYFGEMLRPPGVLYGYIESGNEASLRLNLGIGYRDLGQIKSRIFSRANPRRSERVERLGEGERSGMLALLNETYASHALAGLDQSLDTGRYFIVRRNGEIVAGAQVHTLRWNLLQLPGWRGKLALNLLPRIPVLGKNFTPEDLRFGRAGNFFAREGSEHLISEILETVMAEKGLPFTTLFMDPRGTIERRLLDKTRFGLLGLGIGGGFHVLGEFKGIGDDEIDTICRAPMLISPRDPL